MFYGHAQGTASAPEVLTDGTKTVAIDEYGYRQYFYYSYTSADEDRLLSMTLPTTNAEVIATFTGGNPYQSEFPTFCVGDATTQTTSFACYAPKGKTVYLKVTLQVLAFPEGTTSADIIVSSSPCDTGLGKDPATPILVQDGDTVYLPLYIDSDTFSPDPIYVGYTVEHDGYLYLNFKPSVTSVYYRSGSETNFTFLKAEYIMEGGKAVGSKAILEVKKGENLMFEVKGFYGVMLTTTLENPEPGTSSDFPLAIESEGLVAIPDEPGDWYWSYTPPFEGFIELTSDMPLEGGHIEVMMDGNHLGSFTIYDALRLRCWVYDRMEYLIHLRKEGTTSGAQFNLAMTKALPCDDSYTAENMESGKEYLTPAFSGTYYYRIDASETSARKLKLNTSASGLDSRTRVNLYEESDLTETIARGLDMECALEAAKSYIMQWTVFDVDKAIPFAVTLTEESSSVSEIGTSAGTIAVTGKNLIIEASGEDVSVFATDGTVICKSFVDGSATLTLAPGFYIVKLGSKSEKVIIR